MLYKLSARNAKRSMKDYLVYMITMTGIAALMYAFNSLIFSDIVQQMWEAVLVMTTLIGLVTIFIILIVGWLINYMVHFMLEKRSREFGTYLLLGMSKKQVSKLYMRENMLLGAVSLLAGILVGTVLQQIIMSLFYHLFSKDYQIQIGGSPWCLVMTGGCYAFCYFAALRKNRKIFRKTSIADFMNREKQGEAAETGHEKQKQWLFFISIAYFILFYAGLFRGNYTTLSVVIGTALFILSIYLFYQGLSAWLVCYIHKRGKRVYTRDGLFLLRQLSSKLRTMRFTMGTLTFLFTGALLGGTVAMMLASYQQEAIERAFSFDITVYSENVREDFAEERKLLAEEGIKERGLRLYRIYTDEGHEMNDYLFTHVSALAGGFVKEDGSLDEQAVAEENYVYYDYDTYMALGDYNYLRQMLGYEPVILSGNQYLLHLKERVQKDMEEEFLHRSIVLGGKKLEFAGTRGEGFSQNGLNGADYIFVVPDEVCERLTPYYSVLAMNTAGTPKADLQEKLERVYYQKRGMTSGEFMGSAGSDQILTMGSGGVAVKANLEVLVLSIVSAITFPLAYISLIFLCVALTILTVQQLSDSSRYRSRYDVLRKLGVGNRELNRMVGKQLAMYYLVPLAAALMLSSIIGIFAGERFVFYTGATDSYVSYYAFSVLVFMGIFLLYFGAAYIGFKRNVEQVFVRMD